MPFNLFLKSIFCNNSWGLKCKTSCPKTLKIETSVGNSFLNSKSNSDSKGLGYTLVIELLNESVESVFTSILNTKELVPFSFSAVTV